MAIIFALQEHFTRCWICQSPLPRLCFERTITSRTADNVVSRQEEIKAVKAGEQLPSHRVVQLRSMGMHSIRHEFVVRLLRSSLRMDTLSIYWEQGNDFMLKRNVESVHRRLVLGRRKHVSGEFADLWLLCYPDDEQIREWVEQEIDRMVREVNAQGAELSDER